MASGFEDTRTTRRPRHTDLQQLTITHTRVISPRSYNHVRCHGAPPSPESSVSTISLASPSLAAIRKYYRDHGLLTAFQTDISLMEIMALSLQNLPRRQSKLSPGGLANCIGVVGISSPSEDFSGYRVHERGPIAEVSRNMLLDGVNRSELAKLGDGVAKRFPSSHPRSLSTISARTSSKQPHDRLKIWGQAYLESSSVADVHVRAVQLRIPNESGRSSNMETSEQRKLFGKSKTPAELVPSITNRKSVIVRARVIPRENERKPFLIQRRFELEELRAIPPMSSVGAMQEPLNLPDLENLRRNEGTRQKTTLERSKKRPIY